jgi:hypothetical protein
LTGIHGEADIYYSKFAIIHIPNPAKVIAYIEIPVVAKFATTAKDGKIYQMVYYNLDMIISVGYRVKSNRGIQFRIWANNVLKEYIIKEYAINHQAKAEHRNK